MNVDLKRVRDAAIEEGHWPVTKRRALSLSTPLAADNPDEDRLEDWMRVVEVSDGGSYPAFPQELSSVLIPCNPCLSIP